MKKRIFRSIFLTSLGVLAVMLIAVAAVALTPGGVTAEDLPLPFAIAFLAALLVSAVLAKILSEAIVRPIKDIDPEKTDEAKDYEEINELVRKLGRQNELIRKQMADLRRRQIEFNIMTENMSEGFILIDNKSEIVSYNKSALQLLGAENIRDGQHFIFLNRSHAFVSVVSEALKGTNGKTVISIGPRVFRIFANPIKIEEKTGGVAVIVMDITEEERREEMRREFTSNVSHELKTPLTSISGFSELLINRMVADEDVPKFAQNIYDEAARLIVLINDIIKLSRLDEVVDPVLPDSIDLFEIAEEVKNRLALTAAEGEVDIFLSGDKTEVVGNRSILSEMIYNLCDNAIKYNRPDGRVDITVGTLDGKKFLSVKDTGIGIPSEHIGRIFERFYRVDKSHSKKIGGTGLGLSIVKHAAEYHKATLSVESKVDIGTEITVVFP